MKHEHYGRGLFRLPAWPEVPVDDRDPSKGMRRATAAELHGMREKWRIVAELEDGTCIADSGLVRGEFDERDPWAERGMGEPIASDQHHGHGSRYRKLPEGLREPCHRVEVVRHREAHGKGSKGKGKALTLVKREGPAPMSPKGHGPLPETAHRAPDPGHVVRKARAHPDAVRLRVRPAEAREDDIVASGPRPANRFYGERGGSSSRG